MSPDLVRSFQLWSLGSLAALAHASTAEVVDPMHLDALDDDAGRAIDPHRILLRQAPTLSDRSSGRGSYFFSPAFV